MRIWTGGSAGKQEPVALDLDRKGLTQYRGLIRSEVQNRQRELLSQNRGSPCSFRRHFRSRLRLQWSAQRLEPHLFLWLLPPPPFLRWRFLPLLLSGESPCFHL